MTSASIDLDLDGLLGNEPFVRGLARSLLFDGHQVDDVVQQTWIEAIKASRSKTLEAGGSKSWLARVVRSRASNVRRDAARRTQHERAAARVESLPSTDELIEHEDTRSRVVRAVAALPEKYRVVILLRYYEGLTPRAIAAELDEKRDTVATRLKRGLAMLRDRLDTEHDGDRRAWALGLVPLAVPARTTALGAFVAASGASSLGAWIGGILAMKYTMMVVAMGLVLLAVGLGLGTDLFSSTRPAGAEPSTIGTVDAGVENVTSTAPTASAAEGAATDRKVVADDEARGGPPVFASVEAAMAGFRGRLVRPDGTPAVDELVRLVGLDVVTSTGGVFDPDNRGGGMLAGGFRGAQARTDQDGVFLVERVRPDALYAMLAGADGADPTWHMPNRTAGPGELVDLGTIALIAKGSVRGTLVDEDGEPVANAEVWAADIPAGIVSVAPLDRLNARGAVLVAIPRVEVEASAPAQLEAYHSKLRSHFGKMITVSNDETEFVALEIPAWFEELQQSLPVARTWSGPDGSFELRGITSGVNALIVRADGFLRGGKARVRIEPGVTEDVGELELDRGDTCAGVIRTSDGQPLAGIDVRVANRPGIGLTGILFAGGIQKTGPGGTFEFDGMPREDVFLSVRRAVGDPWVVFGPYDYDDEEIRIDLAPRNALTVKVRAAEDPSVAIEDVRAVLRRGPPLGELSMLGLQPELPIAPNVGPDGLVFDELEQGHYTVQVSAPDRVLRVCVVEVGDEGAECVVELQPAAPFTVRITDPHGAPIEGAQVFALPVETPDWARSVLFGYGAIETWDRLARFVGFSGSDGRLVVATAPAGAVEVCVRHPAFGAGGAQVTAPGGETAVILQPCASVEGRVTDNGKPASAEKYRLVAEPSSANSFAMPVPGGQAALGPGGEYRFAGLPAGDVEIRVETSLATVASLGGLIDNFDVGARWFFGGAREVQVSLQPEEEKHLDFDINKDLAPPGSGGRIHLRLTIDGAPASGYRVIKGGYPAAELFALNAQGEGWSEELVPEKHTIRIEDDDGRARLWQGDVAVTQGGTAEVVVDLRMVKVAGIVRRGPAGGSLPAANHGVSLVGQLGGGAMHVSGVRTDEHGRFSARVPAGKYSLRAEGVGGQGVVQCELQPGAHRADLEIEIAARGVLAGQLIIPPGLKLQYVRFEVPGKNSFYMTTISEAGTFAQTGLPVGPLLVTAVDSEFQDYAVTPGRIEFVAEGMVDQVLRVGAAIDK